MIRWLSVFILLLAPQGIAAQTIAGQAEVVDGDTLMVEGQRIRLFGIDALEGNQTCDRSGERWACGEVAAQQLRSLIEGNTVSCEQQDIDQYGRIVAVCRAGRYELGKTMVEYGWATAFRRYSNAYVGDELRAKAERRGMWNSTFELPEQHRRAQQAAQEPTSSRPTRASASASAPDYNCMIKGNRNRRGEWIYHLPGMPYYNETRPEELFCTEAQALAAGYRRSRARQ